MSWGGAREGAGRKLKGTAPRVTYSCRIKQSTKDYLQQQSVETGLSVGEVLDTIVEYFQDVIKEGS